MRPEARLPAAVVLSTVASLLPLTAQDDPKSEQDPATRPTKAQPSDADAEAAAIAVQSMLNALAEDGIRVDLEKKAIAVDAVVNRPDQLIEYLLVNPRGKAHEALLVVEVTPSLLNTAFLSLGLEPGTNATTEEIEPKPTLEQIEAGAPWFRVIPPTGPEVWLTASWKDPETGEAEEMAIEDFLIDVSTGLWIEGNKWYYIGGRTAAPYRGDPPAYMADLQGNLVSVPYMAPGNHLVTMHHERCADEENWWIAKKCPPPGHPVELVFHTVKPDLITQREKRLAKERAEREAGEAAEKDGERDGAKKEPADAGEDGGSSGGDDSGR